MTLSAKPAIVAVEDERQAESIVGELRRAYGDRFDVHDVGSGEEALALLQELGRRGEPVALVLADQHLPGTTGSDVLRRGRNLAEGAKRVLRTPQSDAGEAIDASNELRLDEYVIREWEWPRVEQVLSRLLREWRESYRPPPRVTVIASRFSEESHAVRDFLARNHVDYRWLDAEHEKEAAILFARVRPPTPDLPLLVFDDGTWLQTPTNRELAEKLGLRTRAELPFYDLIIVGGGPAGLAAAVYGASEGLRTVLVERDAPGGQAGQSSRIENYLGFPEGVTGSDLARQAAKQAARFGAEMLSTQEAKALEVSGPARIVRLSDGSALAAHTVVLAAGVSYRRLEAPGVEELTGKGIYYGAALTEAPSCAQQDVYVVGGANSAGQAAVYFARFARRVTIMCRGDSLAKSMSHYLIQQIGGIPNIEVRLRAEVVEAHGKEHLEALTLSGPEGEETVLASALFVFIGAQPRTEWLEGAVLRDDRGFVLAGPDVAANGRWPLERDPYLLETSVPGVFVAGDVRHRSIKRVASAVGEGSMAVQFVHQYLASGR